MYFVVVVFRCISLYGLYYFWPRGGGGGGVPAVGVLVDTDDRFGDATFAIDAAIGFSAFSVACLALELRLVLHCQ